VGIKSAVGDQRFWTELVTQMSKSDRGVDFITIDGGEGGTGAAPLVFTDSVSLPFRLGFTDVYKLYAEAGRTDEVTWIGSAKLGIPENAIVAFALGADMVNTARGAMLALGCIQAQKCHTDHCPTGVATQNPWLAHGLDPTDKSVRVANYLKTMRRDLLKVGEACGVAHPGLLTVHDIDLVDGTHSKRSLREVYGYESGWGLPSPAIREEIAVIMRPRSPEDTTAPGHRPVLAGPGRTSPTDVSSHVRGNVRPCESMTHHNFARAKKRRWSLHALGRRTRRRPAGRTASSSSRKPVAQRSTSCSLTVLRIARIRRASSRGSAW
jgi:glutamate synthase (ferredoxin)